MSKIIIVVGSDGGLDADFIAYAGAGCQADEQRLRERLARYGVHVKASVAPKTDREIAEELRQSQPAAGRGTCRIKV